MQSYQDEILTPLAESKEFYDGVATEADAYGQQLALNQERLQKLPQLDEVDSWLAERQALFDRAHYGTTLVEVATLLSSHAEVFKANLPAKKELLENMTTEQEEIATRLAASRASMAVVEEAADAYVAASGCGGMPESVLTTLVVWVQLRDGHFAQSGAPGEAAVVGSRGGVAEHDGRPVRRRGVRHYVGGGGHVAGFLRHAQAVHDCQAGGETVEHASVRGEASHTSRSQTLNSMESYQDVINERLAALRERMTATEAAAEQYQYQLLVTQERLQKIPALERILAWLGEQAAVFASDNFGSTLREVRELRAAKRNYERGAAPHTEVRGAVVLALDASVCSPFSVRCDADGGQHGDIPGRDPGEDRGG